MAFVTFYFINTADSFIDILLRIHLGVDSDTGSFGHTGVITVEFSNRVTELKLSLNSKLLFLDTNGNIKYMYNVAEDIIYSLQCHSRWI